jgi:nucleoside-diphosphate-sugar epimerase
MRKKKILVTGASGFIGSEVSRQLASEGYRPRLLIRRPLREPIRGLNADFVKGNLRDPKSLADAVKGVDAIVHLGARATFESYERLKPDILEGSLNLMHAAAASGVQTFVYSSSLLIYGDQDGEVDESTPAKPVLDYGRIKLETETTLTQMASASKMNFSAIRLPHVYGVMDLYFQQLRKGLLILPGLGKNIFTHLHVSDAARLLITAANLGYNGMSPVGDELPATWAEFLTVVRHYCPTGRIIILPCRIALMAAALLSPLTRYRPHPGLETPGAVRTYNFNISVKPDLLWKDFQLERNFPTIYEGIPAVVRKLKMMAENSR